MTQLTHNTRRAMRFGHILTWCKDWGSDQEGLIDLLTDAMHWCDAHGEDFHIAFAQACRHYINELNDEQQDERRMPPIVASDRAGNVPPDPEGINDSRAEWAVYALVAFMSQTGTDRESAVTDLLCDLMHLADRDGSDFSADLERARMHYACETQPDSATSNPPTTNATKGTNV